MLKRNLTQIIKDKYWWLVIAIFGLIFMSRFFYLGADLPSSHIEIEEKVGGYNARNMVFLNHWPLYQNWFQSMIYVPIQTILSYFSFKLLGVGLAQFRFPTALASFVGLIFFYLVLLKQTNRFISLFGLLLYAFNFEITAWNRSALSENFYLLFMPLSVYLLIKENMKAKYLFVIVFLAALNIVAKLDGYSFYLAIIMFLLVWSLKKHFFLRNLKAMFFGSMAALLLLLALFAFLNAFNYFFPMYRFYFELFGKQASFIKGIIPTLLKLISILLSIDAYLFLAFLISLPVLLINYKRLAKIDYFILLFLFLALVTRLQVSVYIIYWKRLMFLFFPFVYVILRAVFLLWQKPSVSEKRSNKIFWGLILSSVYSFSIIYLYLKYFNRSIARPYAFVGFSETFHRTNGSFFFLLFIIITALCLISSLIIFGERKWLKNVLGSIIVFLALLSFVVNGEGVSKMFLPQNIKYSYKENQKYLNLIPEKEMIVTHEQGFRAFVYLGKNDFYFNHDGGPNPNPYREILEREDLRYFILNIEEFWRVQWGLPNKVRLELIKQAYPNLKLLGIFFASRVPLAIYDKYGNP